MELTQEQKNIIQEVYSDEKIIKVSAYSGTGKTSTICEVIKESKKINSKSKILYIVFNKDMANEARIKFDTLGLDVDVFTTHSFALRRLQMILGRKITVMPNIDMKDYWDLKNKNARYKYCKVANIKAMFDEFCLNFDKLDSFIYNMKETKGRKYKLDKLYIKDVEIDFFKDLYNYFIKNDKFLFNMFLKYYACEIADKVKGYSALCVDEGQDSNLFMINIIKRINCDKLFIFGDKYQSIYGFNRCVNIFEKFEGKTLPLSISFRFNNGICEIANKILDSCFEEFEYGSIKNSHNITEIENKKEKTIIFRRNATLFEHSVYLIDNNNNIKVKFMDTVKGMVSGNFDDVFSKMLYFYDKLLESTGSEQLEEFRNKFKIQPFEKEVDYYLDIANKSGEKLYRYLHSNKHMLGLDMFKFFNFFLMNERRLVEILEKVRKSEDNDNPDKIYTMVTAHASKGREWSHVRIAEDAWSLSGNDDKCLAYVACTRAKHELSAKPIERLLEEKICLK